MDAFFREFDQMSDSSRHAEYFWIFNDVKVEFHGSWVPWGVRFLEALWKKYGSCLAYLKLGVYIRGSMLTLLCCMFGTCEKIIAIMSFLKLGSLEKCCTIACKYVLLFWLHVWTLSKIAWNLFGEKIVAGVTAAAAYGVVAEAADDVVAKVVDEVIAEIVENASNMQKIPAVNNVIALGMIPKQDSQHKRGSCCRWDSHHMWNPCQRSSRRCFHGNHSWSP